MSHANRTNLAPKPPDDEQLLYRARSGDRDAFASLIVRYQDRVFATVFRMVGDADEARELTQETFCRALSKSSAFRGDSQPFTWIFRIAVNLTISRLRKIKRRRTFSLDAPPPGRNGSLHGDEQASSLVDRIAGREEQPPEVLRRREEQQAVVSALGRIDEQSRALIVLRDIEGVDYQTMADTLGLPLGTLKSRLFRARAALLRELKAADVD